MEKDDSSSEPRPVVPDSTHWRAVRCMGTRDARRVVVDVPTRRSRPRTAGRSSSPPPRTPSAQRRTTPPPTATPGRPAPPCGPAPTPTTRSPSAGGRVSPGRRLHSPPPLRVGTQIGLTRTAPTYTGSSAISRYKDRGERRQRHDRRRAAARTPTPTGLTATANGQTRIDPSWNAPSSNGGTAVTGSRIEVCADDRLFRPGGGRREHVRQLLPHHLVHVVRRPERPVEGSERVLVPRVQVRPRLTSLHPALRTGPAHFRARAGAGLVSAARSPSNERAASATAVSRPRTACAAARLQPRTRP